MNALDYFQESDMSFTVQARMIYDNYRGVDVLQELRNRMSWNGFDPGRVAPSANVPPTPTPASFDCPSWYGDSAMLLTLTGLTAAIAGPWSEIGEPPGHPENGLWCFSPSDANRRMVSLPVWHSQPTFVDIHSQKTYPTANDTAIWAKNFYSAVWSFLQYRGMTGSRVVFGETNPVNIKPQSQLPCDQWTKEQAQAMLYGTPGNNNGYKHSTLFLNHGANVVMRPWHDWTKVHEVADCPSPSVINPPFNPFAP